MIRTPSHHRHRRPLRGVAAVEFAVCLPLLVLLTMGTIEACNIIQLQHSLTIAAYEGARAGVVKGAKKRDIKTAARQVMADRGIVDGRVRTTPSNPRSLAARQWFTVTTSARTSDNSVFPGFFDTIRTSSVTMMKEY